MSIVVQYTESSFKALLCFLLISVMSGCTGFNSLYPKYSGYDGSDSAVILVRDDSYNQSIYAFELTKEGCFENKGRRLLTRNLAFEGSGKDIYEYKVKADQYYIVGVQSPGYFHYRTFIPELNETYAISSGQVFRLPQGKNINNISPDDFKEQSSQIAPVKTWNIKNICPGIFGSKSVD